MAVRNARTGGARKRVAGETKKGATPKKKGAATRVITGDRPNPHAEFKSGFPPKTKPHPEDDTTVKTKKVNPNDPMHPERVAPRTRRVVEKPAVKAPAVKKAPAAKSATKPNPGMVSKPAVKEPASSGRVRNFVSSIRPAPKKPMP